MSSITYSGDIILIDGTAMLEYLPNGKTIGNVTDYGDKSIDRWRQAIEVDSADIRIGCVSKGAKELSSIAARIGVKLGAKL